MENLKAFYSVCFDMKINFDQQKLMFFYKMLPDGYCDYIRKSRHQEMKS